jgi:hypothetical protein
MCTRELALTRVKQANYLLRLRQLQAEGIDVDIPNAWQEPSPLIIEPGHQQGWVCDLGGGNTGYAIWLRIVSLGRAVLTDYEISSEWDHMSIDLAYLHETQGRYHYGPIDYAVNEVLNDQIERGLRFSFRGQMVEGALIAWGYAPVPAKYHREALVPVRLILIDSLGREASSNLLLPGRAKKGESQCNIRGELKPNGEMVGNNELSLYD